jgi:hypothetical protein
VPGAIEALLLALGVAAALMLVLHSNQVEHRLRAGGLLLWVLLPMLFTVWHPIPLYDYYYLFVLPAGALLVGLGIHKVADLAPSRPARRLLVGAALAATVVVASIQSVLVLRQLEYLTDGYVVTYGPPLGAAEQTTRELLDLANQSGGRELSVEIDDVNDAAIGYLARPYLPQVEVAPRRRGPWNVDFDLPDQSGSAPYARTAPPQLTPARSLNVSYSDGVRALAASTTRQVPPGASVGLAFTWTIDGHSPAPLSSRLLWEMALFDPSGREIRRVAGISHDWAQLGDGEVVLSWFTVAPDREAAEGVYQLRVDRLDPVTRQPIPAVGAGAELSTGSVEVRGN